MTAPNGGAGSRTRPHRERQQRRAAIHFQTEPRRRWRVRRSRTRCVTNATLAGNSHAVASTDLRVLDPHVAPVRPANDRPFADHVHLDRGTRLGAALQHDGRWYNAFKAAHGSASSTAVARARALRGAPSRRHDRRGSHRADSKSSLCCGAPPLLGAPGGAPPLLWCSGDDRHSVSLSRCVRVRTLAHQNPETST